MNFSFILHRARERLDTLVLSFRFKNKCEGHAAKDQNPSDVIQSQSMTIDTTRACKSSGILKSMVASDPGQQVACGASVMGLRKIKSSTSPSSNISVNGYPVASEQVACGAYVECDGAQ